MKIKKHYKFQSFKIYLKDFLYIKFRNMPSPRSVNESLPRTISDTDEVGWVKLGTEETKEKTESINTDTFDWTPGQLELLLSKESHYLSHVKYSKPNEPIFYLELKRADDNMELKARFSTKEDAGNLKIFLYSWKWPYKISPQNHPLIYNFFSNIDHLRS